jgi:kumamolisin
MESSAASQYRVPADRRPAPGSVALAGSERAPTAARSEPCDPEQEIVIRAVLRRRADRPAQAELAAHLHAHPMKRQTFTPEEYASRFGAHPQDLVDVAAFLESGGLKIVESSALTRTIVASGRVAALDTLFGIELRMYRTSGGGSRSAGGAPVEVAYRSYNGSLYLPGIVGRRLIGVLGLDNHPTAGPNQNPYPNTPDAGNSVQRMVEYYGLPITSQGVPTIPATGQTIVILSETGFNPGDVTQYFSNLNGGKSGPWMAPNVAMWPGTAMGIPDKETTQDILIAATVAQGASIYVCGCAATYDGWHAALTSLIPQGSGAPPLPDVLCTSYALTPDDDPNAPGATINAGDLNALSCAFEDLAAHHVTVCVASGDKGVASRPKGPQQVSYPASDPWVLACGGTAVCSDADYNLHEYVWNDTYPDPGATGGGVSAHFPIPGWQVEGPGLPPVSLVDGMSRRGVPDVAANGAFGTGYQGMVFTPAGGRQITFPGNGTSAAAPLYAGLFAVLNMALGMRLGFVNTLLYVLAAGPEVVFNQIPAPDAPGGPQDNSFNGVKGYPVQAGWDACTGLGTLKWGDLLAVLQAEAKQRHYVPRAPIGLPRL